MARSMGATTKLEVRLPKLLRDKYNNYVKTPKDDTSSKTKKPADPFKPEDL